MKGSILLQEEPTKRDQSKHDQAFRRILGRLGTDITKLHQNRDLASRSLRLREAPVGIEPTNGGFAVLGEVLHGSVNRTSVSWESVILSRYRADQTGCRSRVLTDPSPCRCRNGY